ncbi:MAG TPA: YlmC/YmxH family sporulation protein [Firmicutes bacterium]|nr:YlmC/YmxH family sporulation protein [Bacillota bacterium]
MRISELREREVVNVNDGRRLGAIRDLELDLEKGTVKAIIVPAAGRIWGKLSRTQSYLIPWEKIVKIGVDTILVDHPVGD